MLINQATGTASPIHLIGSYRHEQAPSLDSRLALLLCRESPQQQETLKDLSYWLVCGKNLWRETPPPMPFHETPAFSLRNPFQSFWADSDAIKRTIHAVIGENDEYLAQEIIKCAAASTDEDWQTLQARGYPATSIDPTDAPAAWPKEYLAWAVRTMNMDGADLREADLSNTDLRRINFERTDLNGANLSGSDLTEAGFYHCDMRNCDLGASQLRSAFIMGCQLHKAYFRKADLTNAYLHQNTMPNSIFHEAILRKAILSENRFNFAQLSYADMTRGAIELNDFSDARLCSADLSDAAITQCDFQWADMRECILVRTDLRFCDMRNAMLDQADMRQADLRDTKLKDAWLSHANLSCADLTGVDISTGNGNLAGTDFRGAELLNLGLDIAPNDIGPDGAYALRKGRLPRILDHIVREDLRQQIAQYDSDPDGDYLAAYTDSDSDSDSSGDANVIADSTQKETSETSILPKWQTVLSAALLLAPLSSLHPYFHETNSPD